MNTKKNSFKPDKGPHSTIDSIDLFSTVYRPSIDYNFKCLEVSCKLDLEKSEYGEKIICRRCSNISS